MTPNRGAKALKKYMLEHDYSQAGLATFLGLSAATISRWLNGKKLPGVRGALDVERLTEGKVQFRWWWKGVPF
jgi:transcriptional regulator with XRE-family HTH domain